MKIRGLLLFLMVISMPSWAESCFLGQMEDLDASTVGAGCEVLTQQEQVQLAACLFYVKSGRIKTARPVSFPIPLKQAREICADFGSDATMIITNQGPFSDDLDKALLQKMNDDQVKKLNFCVDQNHCSGSGFVAAFSKGVPYDLSIQYATCVAENNCSSSAFSSLIERNGNFPQAFEYSQCVASNQCSILAFNWLLDHGGNFDQSKKYSQCVANNNCSINAMKRKVEGDETLNFDDAMELSQCVSKNRCSLLQYEKAYKRLNRNHVQAMSMSRN